MRSKLSGKPSSNSWPSPSALLDNAPDVWRRMDLPRQQRLQSAFFPEGLAFDGDNFGTAETSWNRIQAWLLDLSELRHYLANSIGAPA